jgi:hypothetical protein
MRPERNEPTAARARLANRRGVDNRDHGTPDGRQEFVGD